MEPVLVLAGSLFVLVALLALAWEYWERGQEVEKLQFVIDFLNRNLNELKASKKD